MVNKVTPKGRQVIINGVTVDTYGIEISHCTSGSNRSGVTTATMTFPCVLVEEQELNPVVKNIDDMTTTAISHNASSLTHQFKIGSGFVDVRAKYTDGGMELMVRDLGIFNTNDSNDYSIAGLEKENKLLKNLIKEKNDEISQLQYIIRETLWMARRYANGRCTFAPGTLNECIDLALKLGINIEEDGAERRMYAADGMLGEWDPKTKRFENE